MPKEIGQILFSGTMTFHIDEPEKYTMIGVCCRECGTSSGSFNIHYWRDKPFTFTCPCGAVTTIDTVGVWNCYKEKQSKEGQERLSMVS